MSGRLARSVGNDVAERNGPMYCLRLCGLLWPYELLGTAMNCLSDYPSIVRLPAIGPAMHCRMRLTPVVGGDLSLA